MFFAGFAVSAITIGLVFAPTTQLEHRLPSTEQNEVSAISADDDEFDIDDSLTTVDIPTTFTSVSLWEDEETTEPGAIDSPSVEAETAPLDDDGLSDELLQAAGYCEVPIGTQVTDGLEACALDGPDTLPVPESDASQRSTSEQAAVPAAAPPTGCVSATSGVLYLSRTSACFAVNRILLLVNRNQEVVGRVRIEAVTTTRVGVSSNVIKNSTAVRLTGATGAAAGRTFNVSGEYICFTGSCVASGSFNQPVGGSWVTAAAQSTWDLNYGTSWGVQENWYFTITSPGVAFYGNATAVQLKPRCDNNKVTGMGKGCVYPAVTPTLTFPLTGTATAASVHVQKAITSGLPSRLQRTEPALVAANRRIACPSSLPRDTGYECDEYPFASSRQGAASGGAARVLPGCRWAQVAGSGVSGFSRCMISQAANRAGGQLIASFYLQQRVLPDDWFNVRVS